MSEIYQGSFEKWEDVVFNFSDVSEYDSEDKKKNILELMPEPEKVYLAIYGGGSYDGDALVAYRQGNRYFTVEGGHCSCYGLEGQWNPEEYQDRDLFLKSLDRRIEQAWDESSEYPTSSKTIWKLIKSRVESE